MQPKFLQHWMRATWFISHVNSEVLQVAGELLSFWTILVCYLKTNRWNDLPDLFYFSRLLPGSFCHLHFLVHHLVSFKVNKYTRGQTWITLASEINDPIAFIHFQTLSLREVPACKANSTLFSQRTRPVSFVAWHKRSCPVECVIGK